MATKTFEELKQLAIQIRDEKTNKQNTATRIGTQMLEHLNKLEQDYYDKTATDEELKQRDEKLSELSSNSSIKIKGTANTISRELSLKKGDEILFKWNFNNISENRTHGIVLNYEDGSNLFIVKNIASGTNLLSIQKNVTSITAGYSDGDYTGVLDIDVSITINPFTTQNYIDIQNNKFGFPLIFNHYLNSSGDPVPIYGTNFSITDYIPVSKGDIYSYTQNGDLGVASGVCFYNQNKVIKSSLKKEDKTIRFKIDDDDIGFIRCTAISNTTLVKEKSDGVIGKKDIILTSSFNSEYPGASVIYIPTENINNVWIEFDIHIVNMFKIAGDTKSLTIHANLYIANGKILRHSFSLVEGSTNCIFDKIKIGVSSDNYSAIILGDVNMTFAFFFMYVSNVKILNTSSPDLYFKDWKSDFIIDITSFTDVEEVSIFNNTNVTQKGLSTYVSSLHKLHKLIADFKSKVRLGKNTPFNLLYCGDSIINFQNGWTIDADKSLPEVSNDKPLCMYNTYTFTNKIWQYLNPDAMDNAYRHKKYGGNMTFIKSTANTVAKTGDWVSNYNYSTDKYNSYGSLGGYPANGIKEFLFSTHEGDSMSFTIPVGTKGISVVAVCTTEEMSSDGSNNLAFSTSTKVELGSELLGTFNSAEYICLNRRYDFPLASATTEEKIFKITNTENLNVGIWGIEIWSDNCVRPINVGLAGNSVGSFVNGYNQWIKSFKPDMIIFEANLLNDNRIPVDDTRDLYENLFSNIKNDSFNVIVLITHGSENSSQLTEEADDDPDVDDVSRQPNYYPQYCRMLIEVCDKFEVPYINVHQYQYDTLYNKSIKNYPNDIYVDGIHLSWKGHDMYKSLIDYVFGFSY